MYIHKWTREILSVPTVSEVTFLKNRQKSLHIVLYPYWDTTESVVVKGKETFPV